MKYVAIAMVAIATLLAYAFRHFPTPTASFVQSMQPVVGTPTGSCVPPLLVVDITSGIMSYCGVGDQTWHAVTLALTSPNSTLTVGGASPAFTLDTTSKPRISCTTANIGGSLLLLGQCATGTATCTGATTSMAALASPQTAQPTGIQWQAYVSSANTVTVQACALASLTPVSTAYNVRVFPNP